VTILEELEVIAGQGHPRSRSWCQASERALCDFLL